MKNCINKIKKVVITGLMALAIFAVGFLGVLSTPLMNVANILAATDYDALSTSALKLASMPKTAKLNQAGGVKVPAGTTDNATDSINCKILDPKGEIIFDSADPSSYADVTVDAEGYTFMPTKVGIYRVRYTVASSVKRNLSTQEYQINVEGEKAEMEFENAAIPSIVNGKYQIVLPNPTVTEIDGTEGNLDNLTITVKGAYTGAETYSSKLANDDYFIKKVGQNFAFTPNAEQDCTYYVTYIYKASNNLETTKVFEIKYEKEFDETKIELGYKLSGSMPESLELGVEKELPTVSIYDKNDEDLKLDAYTDVEVIFVPNTQNVAKYESKFESGKDYVLVSTTNKVTAMYPSSEGTYYITYNISSFYSKAQNKVDKTLKYTITNVKDSTAPVTYAVDDYSSFIKVDEGNVLIGKNSLDEEYEIKDISYKIPSKVATNTEVYLPAIYATDNFSSYGEMYPTLERVVVNESGNKTTITTCYKLVDSEMKRVNVNPYEICSYKFTEAGTYTIRYEATDTANKYNYTGTTFTIVVEDGFVDTVSPRITMPTIASYANKNEEFTFSKAQVVDYISADAGETKISDKNVEVAYYYYTGTIDLSSELEKARNNEPSALRAISENENDSTKLTMITPESDFTIVCVAYDDADNKSVKEKTVTILNSTADTVAPSLVGTDVDYIDALLDENLKQDEEISLPTLKISDNNDAKYLTASVEVFDEDGKKVNLLGVGYRPVDDKLQIENAKFISTKAGEYTIVYTISDLGGNYLVKSYFVSIADTKAPVIELDGSLSTVEVGETITLPSITVKDDGKVIDNPSIEVRAGENNPMYKYNNGTMEFTALETGIYEFIYYAKDAYGNNAQPVSIIITAQDTQKPVITLDKEIELYSPITKDSLDNIEPIEIPSFTATDVLNGLEGEPKVTVKSPSGKELTVTKTATGYTFVPTDDGVYTIEYSATDKANNITTETYSMKVGDITKPSIAIEEDSSNLPNDMKVNSTLKLDLTEISVSDAGETLTANELLSLYTNNGSQRFVVRVVGPNGQTISVDEDTDYEYTLTETGTYSIKYIARDKAGNERIKEVSFEVYADDNKSVISTETWSIVLIILSIAILAGVVIYFIKTREKKPAKPQPRLNKENTDDKE